MGGADVRGAILALMATIIYYLGFIVFRVAANRMPELRGTRPLHLVRCVFSNWLWMSGLIVVLAGVVTQIRALTMLPISIAQPIFAASLGFILFYAVVFFGERLTLREWASVGLFGAATVLIGVSNGRNEVLTTALADPVALVVVVTAGVIVGVVVLVGGDIRTFGRHARPLAGIAYGIGSGVSLGVSELGIKGVAAAYDAHGIAAAAYMTPYPYIAIGMAALGLAQLQIGLQRCRMAVVVSVLTVAAKTELAILGPLMFKEPWPADRLLFGLRIIAFVLAIVALTLFPRHDAVTGRPTGSALALRERA